MGISSEHFSEKELRCKDGCGSNFTKPDLLKLAEKLRSLLGRPMIPTSVCRCKPHNKRVGGSPYSKHLEGKAMDFRVDGMKPWALYHQIIDWWNEGKLDLLGGVGVYDWGVHIDIVRSPDGHLRTWDWRKKK